jgi:hypothetical protein
MLSLKARLAAEEGLAYNRKSRLESGVSGTRFVMESGAGGCRWIIAEDFTFDNVGCSAISGTLGRPSKVR